MLCSPTGKLHLIELKKMSGNKVLLSPHQVSFLTRHRHASAWVLIKSHVGKQKDYRILLFKGAQAIALSTEGLQAVEPVLILKKKPIEWAKLFEEIENDCVGTDCEIHDVARGSEAAAGGQSRQAQKRGRETEKTVGGETEASSVQS